MSAIQYGQKFFEGKKQEIDTKYKWIGLAVIAFVFGPTVLSIIKILFGAALMTAGFIIVSMISIGLIQMWPMISRRIAAKKIEMMIADIKKHPIENLRMVYGDMLDKLEERKIRLQENAAKVSVFQTQVDKIIRDYPEEKARHLELLNSFVQRHRTAEDKVRAFKKECESFERGLEKAAALQAVAIAAKELSSSDYSAQEKAWNKIIVDSALDAVQENVAKALYDVDAALENVDSQPAQITNVPNSGMNFQVGAQPEVVYSK